MMLWRRHSGIQYIWTLLDEGTHVKWTLVDLYRRSIFLGDTNIQYNLETYVMKDHKRKDAVLVTSQLSYGALVGDFAV